MAFTPELGRPAATGSWCSETVLSTWSRVCSMGFNVKSFIGTFSLTPFAPVPLQPPGGPLRPGIGHRPGVEPLLLPQRRRRDRPRRGPRLAGLRGRWPDGELAVVPSATPCWSNSANWASLGYAGGHLRGPRAGRHLPATTGRTIPPPARRPCVPGRSPAAPARRLAGKRPEGRWFNIHAYLRSRMAFSISAWPMVPSSARVSPSRSVSVIAVGGEEGSTGNRSVFTRRTMSRTGSGVPLALEGSVAHKKSQIGGALHPVGDGRPVLLGYGIDGCGRALADGDGEADMPSGGQVGDDGVGVEASVGRTVSCWPRRQRTRPTVSLTGRHPERCWPGPAQPGHQHVAGASGHGQPRVIAHSCPCSRGRAPPPWPDRMSRRSSNPGRW